jgi:hypothetical protein
MLMASFGGVPNGSPINVLRTLLFKHEGRATVITH